MVLGWKCSNTVFEYYIYFLHYNKPFCAHLNLYTVYGPKIDTERKYYFRFTVFKENIYNGKFMMVRKYLLTRCGMVLNKT